MANRISTHGRLNAVFATARSSRCFAAAAPSQQQNKQQDEDSDIVLEAFKEQQHQYRALIDGSKNLQPPLNGDDAAIRKYAKDIEALRKKVGMPEHHELLQARMAYDLKVARYDVQSFVANSTETQDFGKLQPVVDELAALSQGIDLNDAKAAEGFVDKITALQKKYNLDNYEKIKDKAIFEMYKDNLDKLRSDVQEEMDTVKRRDHLENVDVDAASLKVSPA